MIITGPEPSTRGPRLVPGTLAPLPWAVALGVAATMLVAGCGANGSKHAASSRQPALSRRGVIVFHRTVGPTTALYTIRPDGGGVRQVSHPPSGSVDSQNGPPGFMPDGSGFIFDRTDADGRAALWTVRSGGGEHALHTPSGMPGDGWPTVSPNGRLVAVPRAWGKPDRYQNIKTGLYVLNTDGSSPRLIASFGYRGDVGGATWSPDGRRIVFAEHNNGPGRPDNASALFEVTPTGQGLRRITAWDTGGLISSPAFSPDGTLILFQIKPPGADFGGNYYTMRADGSDRHKLTSFRATDKVATARWSPDGNSIVFANTGVGGNDDLFVMDADGSHIKPLTRTMDWESAVTWIP